MGAHHAALSCAFITDATGQAIAHHYDVFAFRQPLTVYYGLCYGCDSASPPCSTGPPGTVHPGPCPTDGDYAHESHDFQVFTQTFVSPPPSPPPFPPPSPPPPNPPGVAAFNCALVHARVRAPRH